MPVTPSKSATQKYVLHLVPSGILYPGKINVVGNGVVVDPLALWEEIEHLRQRGIAIDGNLYVSETAHLVFPYHRLLDEVREEQKGKRKIGTTKRGIGPAYADKVARTGLRLIDLLSPERFSEKLRRKIRENNEMFKAFGAKPLNFATINREYLACAQKLRPFITDTVTLSESGRAGRTKTFCSRARRARCSTSISGRIHS